MDLDNIRVAIGEHSYVRRLKEFIESDDDLLGRVNLEFDLYQENIETKFFYKSGCRIQTFHKIVMPRVIEYDPHVVVLVMGGNDLDTEEADPGEVATAIVQLAQELARDKRHVIISQLLDRTNPRISADLYKIKVRICNHLLAEKTKFCRDVLVWTHIRLNNCNTHMHRDGVHLNRKGNFLLYKSIKSSLAHVLKKHIPFGTCCTCPPAYPGPQQRARAGRRHRRR